jgi:tetratricopeptide (TPR) repeat protein
MKRTILVAFMVATGMIWGRPSTPSGAGQQGEAAALEATGDELRDHQSYGEAIKYYHLAMHAGGDEAALYSKIGSVDLRMRSYGPAQAAFEQAAKRNPKDARLMNNLGVVNHLQKRYDTAVKWYKKALSLNENEAVYHYNLGGCWFALEHMDRASAEYARALELDPNVMVYGAENGLSGQFDPAKLGQLSYLMAKLYASRGDAARSLAALEKAKQQGYTGLDSVYKDKEFASLRRDPRLAQLVGPERK